MRQDFVQKLVLVVTKSLLPLIAGALGGAFALAYPAIYAAFCKVAV